MTQKSKGKGPGAAATAHRAELVRFPQGTDCRYPDNVPLAIAAHNDDFPLGIIWEQEHRGEMIRLSIREMKGKRFADVRRFYRRGDDWHPSGKGCTVPLYALVNFQTALGDYLVSNDIARPRNVA